jgi:dTDP-4-amino-4,6-dideoxygalactose transaminase
VTPGEPIPRIPFNRPSATDTERRLLIEATESGRLSGDGAMAARCEELLSAQVGAARVMLTPSATQALEISALLLNMEPGAEVICPSFTHPSSINGFVVHGARPAFCEIRSDTLNLDERAVEERINDRTAAIVCTHYGGVGCEMDELSAIAERRGLDLIEDNAHGLFGSYRDRPLGSIGRFAALSFHETKNVTAGEGGALVLNRAEDVARAEVIRDKGTNRAAFFRGEVDAYEWTDLGSSFLPSELQAAFLLGQLERRDEIQSARRRIWDRYAAELSEWADGNGVTLPAVPEDRRQPAHLFGLRMPGREERDALIAHLDSRGILAVFHYLPLHLSPMGRRLDPDCPALPVTETTANGLVRLPLFAGLRDQEQSRVIDAVREFSP